VHILVPTHTSLRTSLTPPSPPPPSHLHDRYEDLTYTYNLPENLPTGDYWIALCAGSSYNVAAYAPYSSSVGMYGARFPAEIHARGMPLSFTPLLRLMLLHACDQWHSSRVFTPLTGLHCKFRPNTEGPHCPLP
jgi:hypothetical protein